MQRNATTVTTFELHIDEEVDNSNKLYKWYELLRKVYGTKNPYTRSTYLCHQALYGL